MSATPVAPEGTPERRALSSRVTRESWQRDPHGRRRTLAIGHITALLRRHPGDLCDVVIAAVEAATEDES